MQSETWVKRKTLVADWDFWQIWAEQEGKPPRPVADFLLEPDADRIIADHTAASTLRTELEAYKKAWELPEQPVTQGVVPSAGEVAANAVEEARIYRDQRDALRTALTEACPACAKGEWLSKSGCHRVEYDGSMGWGLEDCPLTPAMRDAIRPPTGAGTAEAI